MDALDDRRQFNQAPHPWYGPCDGFGGERQWCSECARVIWDAEDEFKRLHLEGFWSLVAHVVIAMKLDRLVRELPYGDPRYRELLPLVDRCILCPACSPHRLHWDGRCPEAHCSCDRKTANRALGIT